MSEFITIKSDENKNEIHVNVLSILYYAYTEEEDSTVIGVIGKEFKINGNKVAGISEVLTIPPSENSSDEGKNVMMSQ